MSNGKAVLSIEEINIELKKFSESDIFLKICESHEFSEDDVNELSEELAKRFVFISSLTKNNILSEISEMCDKLLKTNRNDVNIIKTVCESSIKN